MPHVLWLVSCGWLVLPLHMPLGSGCSCGRSSCRSSGKHPRTPNGLKDATRAVSVLHQWWGQWPDANVGVLTGAESGIVVLDVDPRHRGDETLRELLAKHGPFPLTPEAATGGGGSHVYFAHPGIQVSNSAGSVGGGLDVRADGGFVVAPPSLHQSGRRYAWVDGLRPDQVPLAAVPPWLLHLMCHAKVTEPGVRLAQRRDLLKLGAAEGSRNASVASLAGHLLRREVDPHAVLDLLRAWNSARNSPPLPDEEVLSTVESIAGAELARRRGGRS